MKDRVYMNARRILSAMGTSLVLGAAMGQCPQLYDYYGQPSATPIWYSCSGTNFSLIIGSTQAIGAFTIDWGDGSALYAGASLTPPQTVSHVYSYAVAEFAVVLTETATGCVVNGTLVMEKSSSASIQIPVGGLTQVCAPSAVEFINSSTNVSPNTVFTWDFGDGSPILTFDHTNWGQTISHTYEQGTVNCETTVRLTAENTCNTLQGGPSIATFNPIRIWDLDDASIAPSATLLCWPDRTVTFANTTDRNCFQQGNIFQRYEYWNFGDYWGTGQDSIIDWAPWPPTFPRTIQYPAIGSYEVMLLDSNYCGVDTAFVTINIVPPPTVSLTATPNPVCAGAVVQFNETTTGGANYFQWNFGTGNGFNWTGAGDQAHTFNTPGNYTVRYTASVQGASAGCADTASVVVNVLPSPTAQFTLDNDAACDQLTVTLTNTSINGTEYLWDFGDGSTSVVADPPPHFYGTAGAYTISLRVANSQGCVDVVTHVVHVYNPPAVQIGAQNVCEGVMSQFTDLTVTEPGNPVISWSWDFGDSGVSALQSPGHLYASSGGFTVTLTATTPYCSGTGTLPVVVEAKPVAAFTPSGTLGCSPHTVAFNNTSTGGVSDLWDFGDGASSSIASPTHTYINLGNQDSVYIARLIVSTTFGCADTVQVPITVAPRVRALFSHNAIPGCAPLNVTFTNSSTGASSYAWNFGDGATSAATSPSHTYVNTTFFLQTQVISLIAYSNAGCSDTLRQQILVYPTPDFTFVAQPDSGCSPHTVTLPSVLGAVAYDWDFGDGSTGTGPAPIHTYYNSTAADVVYPITLIGTNAFGCVDTTYDEVTVFPSPTAQILIAPTTGCHPLTSTLTNLSTGASNISWNYGDGQTSSTTVQSHTHTWYNYAGTTAAVIPVTLTATSQNGCTATAQSQVQVYPAFTAAFVADSIGCTPFPINLTNNTVGGASYNWNMGDGTILAGPEPAHTYVNPTSIPRSHTITLNATSAFGCTSTATQNVVVHPVPAAAFQATPNTQQFPNATVNVLNNSSSGSWSYAWSFGDGQTTTGQFPGPHTYSTWGTYTITLTVSGPYCSDIATQTIVIAPPVPTANFLGQAEGCAPLTVAFTNTSLSGISYQWQFGDGGMGTADNPVYTYNVAGVYTVTLTVTGVGGGTSTMTKVDSIVVHPRATAFFVLQPNEVTVPDQPVFTYNLSGNATIHQWNFGDGEYSTEMNPVHYYRSPGVFDVTLIANNAWNCPDTFFLPAAVTGLSSGELNFPNAFTPSNDGPSDGVYDPRSFNNDHFFPLHEGVEDYKLEIYDRWGELLFVTEDVKVGWDGYYRGRPAKQDVYVWKAYAKFSDGHETLLKGDLTLLR